MKLMTQYWICSESSCSTFWFNLLRLNCMPRGSLLRLWLFFLGDYSWGLGAETPGVTLAPVLPTTPSPLPRSEDEDDLEDMEEDIQITVAHLTEVFSALRSVLTPVFFRGIFAFLTWWVAACQLISSLFGIYFHQYLMLSWAEEWLLCAGY